MAEGRATAEFRSEEEFVMGGFVSGDPPGRARQAAIATRLATQFAMFVATHLRS
jgi:hypothetical protein